ncbi:hypothetical protein PALU110988_27450 [Paenibacillus lupini]|uniref:hypothetical protein n=1 Tax=Paenibacillus lupini TaxID=1450204 RepID=UPI00141EDD29|nr:hypothetical protein [Paenibacillus lupini]NIK24220.1 hypothetical protein [Paenibacillus lupini]
MGKSPKNTSITKRPNPPRIISREDLVPASTRKASVTLSIFVLIQPGRGIESRPGIAASIRNDINSVETIWNISVGYEIIYVAYQLVSSRSVETDNAFRFINPIGRTLIEWVESINQKNSRRIPVIYTDLTTNLAGNTGETYVRRSSTGGTPTPITVSALVLMYLIKGPNTLAHELGHAFFGTDPTGMNKDGFDPDSGANHNSDENNVMHSPSPSVPAASSMATLNQRTVAYRSYYINNPSSPLSLTQLRRIIHRPPLKFF